MDKTRNEMRDCNETLVSLIAKVHNSPTAQPWVKICIAVKAEKRASGTNLILHRIVQRNPTAPTFVSHACFLRPFMFEASNAMSAIFI